jgi:hypothetical protein
MTAAVLLAAAILAQQTATPPAPPNRSVHPAAEAMFETRPQAPDFGVLHAEVAASQPDPEWSPRTEAALSRTFQALPGFSTAMEAFTVTCSASLCEAVGVTRTGLTTDQINEVMGGVQSRTVDEAAAQLRIDAIGTRFSSTRDDSVGDASTASIFAAYWRRRP